jgi:hypothetical protein
LLSTSYGVSLGGGAATDPAAETVRALRKRTQDLYMSLPAIAV